jgi:hypothetical protein
MGMMWMGMMGMGMGNGNGNGMGNELLTIILYFLCPKSYMYPVSATAAYTSPSNIPKSFNSQGLHMVTKILLFNVFHYDCLLYN